MLSSTTSPQALANLLGTTLSKLTFTIYGKGVKSQYTTFSIAKKNGSERVIRAPTPQLKRLQQRLKICLDQLYKPHDAASAFIAGRGILFNARQHTKKAAVFNIDLKAFYDQINFGRVRGLLMSKPYSLRQDTATIIAHMCCVDKVLPQGAPTSPVLSNMICRRLDKDLSLLAKENKARYTRYADDITFSLMSTECNSLYSTVAVSISNEDSTQSTVKFLKLSDNLLEIIKRNGFSINDEKVRLQVFSERQTVTGLKVNKKVNVDRRYIRTTRAMTFCLSKDMEAANQLFKEKYPEGASTMELMVAGRINFIGMVKGIESSVYQSLAKKFNDLTLEQKLPIRPSVKKSDLEDRLHFYGHENRSRLNRCVWVVSFDGIEGVEAGYVNTQGTAFMVEGRSVYTASHVFSKAGDPEFCFIYRIIEPAKKYKMKIESRCETSDILRLAFVDEKIPRFEYLKIADVLNINSGYKLSIVGFPQLLPGHSDVTIIPCTVTNSYVRSTFKICQVDADIQAGNSGGPVVNAYMEVVGMATNGISATLDEDTFEVELAGFNSFISAQHFQS